MELESQEAEHKQKEEEAFHQWEEIRWMDQEHLERLTRLKEQQEEKAWQDAEAELV